MGAPIKVALVVGLAALTVGASPVPAANRGEQSSARAAIESTVRDRIAADGLSQKYRNVV